VSTADPELDYLNGCGIIRYSLRVKVYIYYHACNVNQVNAHIYLGIVVIIDECR
jgi:hypothetical protein